MKKSLCNRNRIIRSTLKGTDLKEGGYEILGKIQVSKCAGDFVMVLRNLENDRRYVVVFSAGILEKEIPYPPKGFKEVKAVYRGDGKLMRESPDFLVPRGKKVVCNDVWPVGIFGLMVI